MDMFDKIKSSLTGAVVTVEDHYNVGGADPRTMHVAAPTQGATATATTLQSDTQLQGGVPAIQQQDNSLPAAVAPAVVPTTIFTTKNILIVVGVLAVGGFLWWKFSK